MLLPYADSPMPVQHILDSWCKTVISHFHSVTHDYILIVSAGTYVLPSSLGRLPLPLEPAADPSRSDDVDGVASTCHQWAMIPPVCIMSTWALGSSDEDTTCQHETKTEYVNTQSAVACRCKIYNTILLKVLATKTWVTKYHGLPFGTGLPRLSWKKGQ